MRDRASEAKGLVGGFGPYEAKIIPGTVPYAKAVSDDVCGTSKGIQGHHNSCYLDATLFSMFYASYVFDTVFNRRKVPGQKQDVYTELCCILKDRIVNPLRKNHFVRADQVMKLRAKLEKLGDIDGLTHEEKDPEEFLNTLLQQVFKEDPYLTLRSGTSSQPQESYMYQLFMEKDETMVLPTVQKLLEQSFIGGDLKLTKIPQVFILQMPRFGKQFKLYDRIFPSPKLRINDITEGCKRQCVVCEDLAAYECKECSFNQIIHTPLFCASFCDTCCIQVHKHHKRRNHRCKKIKNNVRESELHVGEELELFAVVCIETSHYVSFVKFEDNQWVFFDSMADRKGGQDGYNIPCVTHLPELPTWLKDPARVRSTDLRDIPNPIRRMFVDAYMCMYISPTESMY
jgi:ubiquitin thioesterase CYLD